AELLLPVWITAGAGRLSAGLPRARMQHGANSLVGSRNVHEQAVATIDKALFLGTIPGTVVGHFGQEVEPAVFLAEQALSPPVIQLIGGAFQRRIDLHAPTDATSQHRIGSIRAKPAGPSSSKQDYAQDQR